MKILSISRGGMELARVHLHRPLATIGRSPTCDVVLRASGIRPIHFLMEWVGTGSFDPSRGAWSIFDVSESADQSGEGILLDDEPVVFQDFHFRWLEDSLENVPEIGGKIHAELSAANTSEGPVLKREAKSNPPLIELLQVRSDSGAIEEVLHIDPRTLRKARRPLESFPEFKLRSSREGRSSAVQLLLEEMPGAKLSCRGQPLQNSALPQLNEKDLIEVSWKEHRFFLRFVERVSVPRVKRGSGEDPLLFRLSLAGMGVTALLALLAWYSLRNQPVVPPSQPPRVATVEVKKTPPPAPKPEKKQEPVKTQAIVKSAAEPRARKSAPPASSGEIKTVKLRERGVKLTHHKPGKLAASRFRKPVHSRPHVGVNSPARPTDVNQIGILGALKNAAPKGHGVKPNRIVNEAVITHSVSSNQQDDSQVVLKSPPAGDLGSGSKGAPHGKAADLASASTTLKGGKEFNTKSIGTLAGSGGSQGFSVGDRIGGSGSGLTSGDAHGKGGATGLDSGSGFSLNGADGSPDVSGGLDRETVRRIIHQYRGQIRTCYERALLSHPNLNGRIVYRWHISELGPVISVRITHTTVGVPVLETCVKDVIRGMRFPAAKNGRPTIVIYPFVFQARS